MTTFAVNLSLGASTQFSDYGFDSFCRGPDGNYYGIKSDGLYKLNQSGDVSWSVDMGRLNLGGNRRKIVPYAYAQISSEAHSEVVVTTPPGAEYTYPVRDTGAEMITRRYDMGRGLRETYYDISLRGDGSAQIDSFEITEIASARRI